MSMDKTLLFCRQWWRTCSLVTIVRLVVTTKTPLSSCCHTKFLKMCIKTLKRRVQVVWAPSHSLAERDTMTIGYSILYPLKKQYHFLQAPRLKISPCGDRLLCMLCMFPLITPWKIWTDRLLTTKHGMKMWLPNRMNLRSYSKLASPKHSLSREKRFAEQRTRVNSYNLFFWLPSLMLLCREFYDFGFFLTVSFLLRVRYVKMADEFWQCLQNSYVWYC